MKLRNLCLCLSILLFIICLTQAIPAQAAAGLRWVRIHVYHATPTEIFNRLGLTHFTRYGDTLGQTRKPDLTFPVGLIDIVPINSDSSLLVHGTEAGISQFQQRVTVADTPDPSWNATLSLQQSTGSSTLPFTLQNVILNPDKPQIVDFKAGSTEREYELTVHDNDNGTVLLTCCTALSLPTNSLINTAVYIPGQIWTSPTQYAVQPGIAFTFNDLAADRESERANIGENALSSSDNFQLQITLSPQGSGS